MNKKDNLIAMFKQNWINEGQSKDKRISTDCTTEVVLTTVFSSSPYISSKTRYISCMDGENTRYTGCSIISYEILRLKKDYRARYDATNKSKTILFETRSKWNSNRKVR